MFNESTNKPISMTDEQLRDYLTIEIFKSLKTKNDNYIQDMALAVKLYEYMKHMQKQSD